MTIDIRTLAVVVGLVSVLQVTALTTQYWLNRGLPGQGWWVLGTAAWSVGFALNLLRDAPGLGLLAIVGNNLCFIGGLALLHVGMQRFLGQRVQSKALIAVCGAFTLIAFYFTYIVSDFAARSLNFWAGMAVMCFVIARGLWLHRHQPYRGAINYLMGVFFVNGLVLAALAPTVFLGDLGSDIFSPSAALTVTYFVALILSTLWTLGVVILVSQRLNVEHRETAESRERIFNTSPDAILITRLDDGLVVEVNDGFSAMTGFARTDVVGKTTIGLNLFKNPADRQLLITALKAHGICENLELVFARKDGSELIGMLSARSIELRGALQVISVVRDITERKQAEAALRLSEEKFRFMTENASDVIWHLDRNYRFTYISPADERMRGFKQEEVLGATVWSLLKPEGIEYAKQVNAKRLADEQTGIRTNTIRYELEQTCKDGSWVWTEVAVTPYHDANGELIGYHGVTRDITERKRAETALAAAKEAAETANRAKSQFLANMSHELRTPLNAILGFSEMMTRDPDLPPTQAENLAIINRSGEHLLGLINDVLDLAKIEAGRTTLQEHAFDLHQLLADLGDMFRLRATAQGLALRVTWAADTPRFVCADESKLRQVLINLLGNAVKFTPAGSVDLFVESAVPQETDALHCLRFAVQDTGPGIPPAELTAIFEPFVQSASGHAASEGTGLGLPISRQFARLMGGELTVFSTGIPGEGSRFDVVLPVRLPAAIDVAGAEPPLRPRAIGLAPGQPAYRLLVAEDHLASRKLLTDLLTLWGFAVRTAENGLEAIQIWEEWQPHLIWMDMRMPVLDGHAATQRIKATPQGKGTVIIALSASVLNEDRAVVRADGCDDRVCKPYHEDEIVACLVKHLGVRFVELPTAAPVARLGKASAGFAPSGLPATWVEQARQAATAADAAQLLRLAAEVEATQPALAVALAAWVADFDYAAILSALEWTQGTTHGD